MTPLLCRIGIHWWQDWRITLFVNVRQCKWCGKQQRLQEVITDFETARWEDIP